jgi:hypothetical protein
MSSNYQIPSELWNLFWSEPGTINMYVIYSRRKFAALDNISYSNVGGVKTLYLLIAKNAIRKWQL